MCFRWVRCFWPDSGLWDDRQTKTVRIAERKQHSSGKLRWDDVWFFGNVHKDSINLSCHSANLSPTRLGKAIYRELANSNNRSIHDFSARYNCIWTRSWLESKFPPPPTHPPHPLNPERDNGNDLLSWSCFLSSNLFPLLLRQSLDSLSLQFVPTSPTILCVFLFIPLIVIRFYKKKEREREKSSTLSRPKFRTITYIIGSIEEESLFDWSIYSRSLVEEREREKSVIVSPSCSEVSIHSEDPFFPPTFILSRLFVLKRLCRNTWSPFKLLLASS